VPKKLIQKLGQCLVNLIVHFW